MKDDRSTHDRLDEWEEWQEDHPGGSLDTFVKQNGQNWSNTVIEKVRGKINLFAAVARQIGPFNALIPANFFAPLPSSTWQEGMEPVPEYRLERLLGRGGSGEVWSAVGPDGFRVALKFISKVGQLADAELRALKLMKEVRHANLLSVFRTWQLPGHVVIGTELADGNLEDRLQEAMQQGLAGIPRAELIRYLEEAARGLDYLNMRDLPNKPRISHRDVKPHNLFVMGGSVKVGDLGLARKMLHAETGHTGPMTAPFAAPEFFDHKTSFRSDQYSLAATYFYLRTGRPLYEGSYFRVAEGHTRGKPNLSCLPAEERPVLAKALSKKPGDRWPSCEEFVEALKSLPVTDDSVGPLEPASSLWRMSTWIWGVIAIAVVVTAVAVWALTH